MGLDKIINEEIGARPFQGYSDAQQILALILLNVGGGDSLEDMKMLEGYPGLKKLQCLLEGAHVRNTRKAAKGTLKRWRKERELGFPSATAVRNYLACFENPEESKKRAMGKSFVPSSNDHLRRFQSVMAHLLAWLQERDVQTTATLDQDTALIPTDHREAFLNYKKERSYQAFNTWLAERGLVIHTEFWDGNVGAGHEQTRILSEVLSLLPEGIREVYLRSDTGGCQMELLKYCANVENDQTRRFDIIHFAISCAVYKDFRGAACRTPEEKWKPIMKKVVRRGKGELEYTGQECAKIFYVPVDSEVKNRDGSEFRYLAIRERLSPQKGLPLKDRKVEGEQLQFEETENMKKLNIETMNGYRYKLFGIVTNIMDRNAEKIVLWQRKRCGKREEVHDIMKNEEAGGHVPSGLFGANAAWWWIFVLALDLQNILKMHILPEG